jgi:hypothetical protein
MFWRKHLSKDIINEYLDTAFIKYGEDKKIISVGSGHADTEFSFMERNKKEIICIDPSPFSHGRFGSVLVNPKYDYVDELIKNEPDVVGNCHLLLIWPLPNESTYDIEAVEKLKPLSLVIIYEPTGSSGGSEFLKYKWRCNCFGKEQKYYGVHENTVRYMTKYDSFYYTLSYFVSKEYLDKHNEIENEKLDNSFSISKLSHPDRLKK